MTHSIRHAEPEDLVDIMRLFDGALLETDADRIRDQLTGDRGRILMASVADRPVGAIALINGGETSEDVLWTDSVHISAIAVRTERRSQGVGRSLIEAAAEWAAPRPLSATFDQRVRPFYMACGFDIQDHEGRLWGIRRPEAVD